jgi:urease accessory protein
VRPSRRAADGAAIFSFLDLAMKRVTEIKRATTWNPQAAGDFIVLDAQDRHRRRVVFVGEHGATYLLDLSRPAQLHDGDALLLEDGTLVRVTGKPEPLVEIAASTTDELARIAWHLGNRHIEVQIAGDRLRIRRDHVLEDMLHGLGASFSYLEAPFDPESGAYGHNEHGHG